MNSGCMPPGSALQVGKPIKPVLQARGGNLDVVWLLLNRRVDVNTQKADFVQ